MMGFSVSAAGSMAARAQLEKLKKKASKETRLKAIKAGAAVLKRSVQDNAPVRHDSPSGTALPPGALKADIRTVTSEDESGNPTATVGPGPDTAHVAVLVEYGHNIVTSAAGAAKRTVKHVAPVPFMRSAWDQSQEDAAKAMIDVFKKEE